MPPSVPSALSLVFLALPLAGCDGPAPAPGRAGAGAGAPPAEVRVVRMHAVRPEAWPRILRVTGELEAFEEATVSAKVPGRLAGYAVDVGQVVGAGEALAEQETTDLELAVASAEAALATARARLGARGVGDAGREELQSAFVREAAAQLQGARQERDRLRLLGAEGVITQALLDDAQARFDAAEARWYGALDEHALRRALLHEREVDLRLAQTRLSDARLRAPFAGAVAARLAGPGDYLTVGTGVVRLVRFDPLRVRLEVPERGAGEVRVGQALRLEIEGQAQGLSAEVARRLPRLEPQSRVLVIEADLPNPTGALLPGSFVRADIVLEAQARVLSLPAQSLVRFAGLDKVVLVREGLAQEREVRVGRSDGTRVEILAGLAEGEEVVLAPQGLRTGDPLEVQR